MTTNRAVENFRSQHEMSIAAHGVDVWAPSQIGHIDQEAGALAGRVYFALRDLETFLSSGETPDEKDRLNLELAAILFRIGAVRDVVEATNASLTKHGKAPSAQLTGWVYRLNEAEPAIASARTSLLIHQADEPLV